MTICKFILAVCVFTGSIVHGEIRLATLLSYTNWSRLQQQPKSSDDIIIMQDGNQLHGHLENMPVMHYPCGDVQFRFEELATIAISEEDGFYKMQCITRDGQNFVGDFSQGFFVFSEVAATSQRREVDPLDVDIIILKSDNTQSFPSSQNLYSLEFKNGNHLPVLLSHESIELSDGKKDFSICGKDVRQLCYNGGGFIGLIEEKEGTIKQHGFSFIKDKYAVVYVPKLQQIIKFPWSQIAVLQSRNGGFNRDWSPQNQLPLDIDEGKIIHRVEEDKLKGVSSAELQDSTLTHEEIILLNKALIFAELPQVPLAIEDIELKEPPPDDEDKAISDIKFISDADSEDLLSPEIFNQVKDVLIAEELIYLDKLPGEDSGKENNGKDDDTQGIEFLSFADLDDDENIIVFTPRDLAADYFNPDDFVTIDKIIDEGRTKNKTPKVQQPLEMVYVGFLSGEPSFFIGRRKVTNEEYMCFVKATHYHLPSHWIGGQIPDGLEQKPVVNVSYKDAITYAGWVGKRLPSDEEWQKAHIVKAMEDIHDLIDEWTSTGTEQIPLLPMRIVEKHFDEGGAVMSIDAFNNRTGFRLASDEYSVKSD